MILVLCGSMPTRGGAEDLAVLRLEGNAANFSLDNHRAILEDKSGLLGIADVARRDDFRIVTQAGLATGTLWYRFTVLREVGMPAEWTLAFGEPDIDDVRVFVPAKIGGFTEISLGRRIPNGQLPLAARRHVTMLDLPEAEPVTIHVRLASLHKIRFEEAALWRPGALMLEETRQSTLYGIQFGILGVIVMIYVLFGLWLRDGPMLLYALYVGTILCKDITHTGIVTLVIPNAGGNTNYVLSGIGLLGGAAVFIFLWDSILNLRKRFKVMHRIYLLAGAVVTSSLTLVMSSYFSFAAISSILIMFSFSALSIMLAARMVYCNRADVLLKLYLFAFFPVALAWGAQVGSALSPLVPADLGRRMDVFASMTHIAILCVALAYRLGQMQSERMRAEIALAGEQLARQRQRTFIDMATHEFKTPLTTIDSAAQVLELQVDAGRQDISSRIAVIRKSVRRIVDLVDTCLIGERYEQLAVSIKPFAPTQLIERAAERQRNHGAVVMEVGAADLPPECTGDPELLGIALDALIDNARRYAPADLPIEIEGRQHGDGVTFSVCDHGPGVSAEEEGRIFEKYYRGTSSGAVPGTGIGLYLVKTIAELHGGSVRYRPREGGGAVFALTVPVNQPT